MSDFNPDDPRPSPRRSAPAADARLIRALEANWQEGREGAATYRTLAEREHDPRRQATLRDLADAGTRHAQRWEGRRRELRGPPPDYCGGPTGMADRCAT